MVWARLMLLTLSLRKKGDSHRIILFSNRYSCSFIKHNRRPLMGLWWCKCPVSFW
jgi:hypothetical protein